MRRLTLTEGLVRQTMVSASLAAVSLAEGARTLWQEELLVDYIIEVEDEEFKVHKVVMASVSDYFKAMLTVGLTECETDRVRLEGLDASVVSDIIEFIYTGQFGKNHENTEELLACALYLQIPALIEECTTMLLSQTDEMSCIKTLSVFRMQSHEEGIERTMRYIRANFENIINMIPQLIEYDNLLILADIWQTSEYDLFLAFKHWVEADIENRCQHLNELMHYVRFALMTTSQLTAIKLMKIYTESQEDWCHLVHKAAEYHYLPTHRKLLEDSVQNRVRAAAVPVCYPVDDASEDVFYSLHDGKSWKQHKARDTPHFTWTSTQESSSSGFKSLYSGKLWKPHEAPNFPTSYRCAPLVVNNYLIVCDQFKSWYVFDPRTLKWSSLTHMVGHRCDFAAVYHGGYLYVLGGGPMGDTTLKARIERYDFKMNTWEVIPTELPVPRTEGHANIIDDHIYIAGGYTDNSRQISTRLDCLDLSTDTWRSKAPMPMPNSNYPIRVLELWGEEVLFYFDDPFVMRYYRPSADQWSVWDCLSDVYSQVVAPWDSEVLPYRNTLFLLDTLRGFKRRRRAADADSDHRVSVKWTLGKKPGEGREMKLDDFPADAADSWNRCPRQLRLSLVLSLPPHSLT